LPVGCIGVGLGLPGAVSVTESLRSVAHALRGWPTPYAASVKLSNGLFTAPGVCNDEQVARQLRMVGQQVAEFVLRAYGRSVTAAA
jgi:FMN reductase